jgi:uncharacterized membrane protein YccC
MSAPRLQLDFVASRTHGGVAGAVLVVAGAICLGLVLLQLRTLSSQHQGLELRRAALERQRRSSAEPLATVAGLGAQNVDKTLRELATPWSQLLAELESASSDNHGSVALLAIEPDHSKHRVRLTAEARTLELALAYVQRLQATQVLRYPMLDSHEFRKDDQDHPVRFQISADWSDAT